MKYKTLIKLYDKQLLIVDHFNTFTLVKPSMIMIDNYEIYGNDLKIKVIGDGHLEIIGTISQIKDSSYKI